MPFVSVIRSIPIIALNGELLHLHTYPPEIVTLVFECLLTIYLKLFMSFPFLLLFLEPRFLAKDPALKQKDNFFYFEFRKKSAIPYICEKWPSSKRGLRDQYFCQTNIW